MKTDKPEVSPTSDSKSKTIKRLEVGIKAKAAVGQASSVGKEIADRATAETPPAAYGQCTATIEQINEAVRYLSKDGVEKPYESLRRLIKHVASQNSCARTDIAYIKTPDSKWSVQRRKMELERQETQKRLDEAAAATAAAAADDVTTLLLQQKQPAFLSAFAHQQQQQQQLNSTVARIKNEQQQHFNMLHHSSSGPSTSNGEVATTTIAGGEGMDAVTAAMFMSGGNLSAGRLKLLNGESFSKFFQRTNLLL